MRPTNKNSIGNWTLIQQFDIRWPWTQQSQIVFGDGLTTGSRGESDGKGRGGFMVWGVIGSGDL